MNPGTEKHHWFEALVESNNMSRPDGNQDAFAHLRQIAGTKLKTLNLPGRSQEAWRYAGLDGLYQKLFVVNNDQPEIGEADLGPQLFDAACAYRLVLVNGRLAPELSRLPEPDRKVEIRSLARLNAEQRSQFEAFIRNKSSFNDDAFAQLNRALTNDGLYLKVASGAVVDKPIELVHVNRADGQQILIPPSFLVVLESEAQAEIVERFLSPDDSGHFYNAMTDIQLHERASLVHYRIQSEGANAHHLSRVSLYQQRASAYQSVHVALNTGWSRSDIRCHLQEPEAACRISGVYTVGETQQNDFHIDIRHQAPGCDSDTTFRGVVHGAGRAVFDGRILVEKLAQDSNARLSNNNLLLVEGAEVDSKPQLEIHADNVKCSHAATVGRIDPNHLFYLRSRGIDEQRAFRMLCLGFVQQVIGKVDNLTLREAIQQHLGAAISGGQP